MLTLSFYHFLLLDIVLPGALGIPTTPSTFKQPTLSLNNTTPFLKSEVHCKGPIFRWRYMNTPDCLKGLRQLPSTHHHGTFHTGGEPDDFRLPREIVKGHCSVSFELIDLYSPVESTWDTLRTAAAELVLGCAKRAEMGLTKGGWTTAGRRDGIIIRVQKP